MDLQQHIIFVYRYIESNKVAAPVLRSVRLLDQLRERICYLHYSLQTEKACLYWAQFFVCWHGRNGSMRHPKNMGKPEVESFLTMLTNERQVSCHPSPDSERVVVSPQEILWFS
ncbi:MAG: phage integrase N-terminal SAM-like domain-containing protein [Pseudomonadota bacterium]